VNHGAARGIFAVVGLAGTGKSSVVQILCDVLPAPIVYFGGVVVSEVQRRGQEVTEPTERRVREELRQRLGMSAIAQLAIDDIETKLAGQDEIVIDGLYSYAEYELLQDRYPEMVSLIAVHATKALREERLAHRPNRPLTPAEIHSRDLREVRTLDKATAIALADHHLINNSTLSDLRDQVIKTVDDIRNHRVVQSH
jgi:dephospho-CoA kinase